MGAGGAMGRRVTRGLREIPGAYELRFVEVSSDGIARMREEFGTEATEQSEAVKGAQTVVLATPDRLVAKVTASLIPQLDAGTNLLTLDPAALHAERVPRRADVNVFACHPTHPPLYWLLEEETLEARKDYWGSGKARQALVIAQAWGDPTTFDVVQSVAEDMFAPIVRSHRITVDQMALLEPAMSESVTNACVALLKNTRERVIETGVPEQAADDFFWGHFQIAIALIFEQLDWRMSAGAEMAMREAQSVLFKDDWHRILQPDAVLESTRSITTEH
jgi:hypothetical protein